MTQLPSPSHEVVYGGLPAWEQPGTTARPQVELPLGTRVAQLERRGDWARVATQNGWTGWVDARWLRELAAPAPPAPAAVPGVTAEMPPPPPSGRTGVLLHPDQVPPAKGPPPPPRRRGTSVGCLLLLVVLGLLVAIPLALLFRVPHQLGLMPSAEQLLSGTPDRAAAAAIIAELERDDVATTGMRLYVLPLEGNESVLAYAVVDFAEGFRFPRRTTERLGLTELFGQLAGDAAREAGVTRVAVEYRDGAERTFGVLTASVALIDDLQRGLLDEEVFLAAIDGRVDLAHLLSGESVE